MALTYFVVLLILFVAIAASAYSKRVREKRQLNELIARWGRSKKSNFEFNGIARYATIGKGKAFHQLTSQTIDDIDIESLFKFVDHTTSRIGQQVLYQRIVQPSGNPENDLQNKVDLFSKDKNLRLKIQQELLKLDHPDAYYISSLFHDHLIDRPKWLWILKVELALTVLLTLLTFKFQFVAILLLLPFSINMFLHYWNKNNTMTFLKSFPQLNVLIHVVSAISRLDDSLKDQQAAQSVNAMKSFQTKASFISFDNGGIQSEFSQLGLYLYELIKAFFLIEVMSLFAAVRELETRRSSIETLFTYIGELDVAISIVSLRAGNLKTCVPQFISEKKEMAMKGIYHPLISDCEPNDLTVSGKSILITGSNMSGKSTFLRTIAINSILAQSIHTCFAQEFNTPVLKQFSSIHMDDDLLSGKSYYMMEVESISNLIEESTTGSQKIFFLDEVFKGTNTVERIAGSKAVLSFLNQGNNIVFVATHDLELATMLKDQFDLYHFTETIEDRQLHFDHKIKTGPLTSTNAIRILEIAELPTEIITDARKIADAIRTK